MNRRVALLLLPLLVCLGLRAMTLEYPSLIDPTESRYAFIAQEMYLSGNWIVPQLPLEGGLEPYLGKPPLHFWLTAASFTVMHSMDEWVARLPSFLALIIMIVSLLSLRNLSVFHKVTVRAALIFVSSALMFFLGGASVVDVTLAAFTTVAFVSFIFIAQESKSRVPGLIMFASLALGFLTKGPIALILCGFPILVWILVTKRYVLIARVPWISGIFIFLLITVPWFLLAEKMNPGFMKYFFVNENFGRYLQADYGDRYGSGHKRIFGTIWLMFFVGFLPWSFPLVGEIIRRRKELIRRSFWIERPLWLYSLFWGLSPVVIFTFAKQINSAYLTPGMPGFALFTALLLKESPVNFKERFFRVLGVVLIAGALGAFLAALITDVNFGFYILSIVPLLSLFGCIYHLKYRKTEAALAVATVAAFSLTIFSVTDTIDEGQSAEPILRCLTHFSEEAFPEIGVVDSESYSAYFYSRAWHNELEKPVKVLFLDTNRLPSKIPEDLILRTREWKNILHLLPQGFHAVTSVDRWTWLSKRTNILATTVCPAES